MNHLLVSLAVALTLPMAMNTAFAKKCRPAPGTALDFDALDKRPTAKVMVAPEVLKRAISKRHAADLTIDHAVQWKKERAVVVYRRCTEHVCYGGVVLLKTSGGKAKALKRAHLPMDKEPFIPLGDALTVGSVAITDVDGDGTDELLVLYEILGEPLPAVGHQAFTFLTIWNLGNLTLRWDAQVGLDGQANVLPGCRWQIRWRDMDCDARQDLVLTQTCSDNLSCLDREHEHYDAKECTTDFKPETTEKVWLTEAKARRYRPQKGKARYKAADRAKPFLVIVGSIASHTKAAFGSYGKAVALSKRAGVKVVARGSREFPRLACCYETLIAGQYATKSEADTAAAALKAKGVKGYVRRGF